MRKQNTLRLMYILSKKICDRILKIDKIELEIQYVDILTKSLISSQY